MSKIFKKMKYFLSLSLFLIPMSKSYSFYELVGDISIRYDVIFEGEIILDSRFMSYTNKNAKVTFDYSLVSRSEFTDDDRRFVVSWRFSPLTSHNLPNIFERLWLNLLTETTKDAVYTVKLPSDNFLVFQKNGERHPLGYFFEILFPIIDIENYRYKKSYKIEIPNPYRETDYMNIDIEGWDFFRYSRPSTDRPIPSLETNTALINKIYTEYSERRKNKQDTIYWLQMFETATQNIYKQNKGTSTLVGMYFLDPEKAELSRYILIGDASFDLPFVQNNSVGFVNIKFNGKFTATLADPHKDIDDTGFTIGN